MKNRKILSVQRFLKYCFKQVGSEVELHATVAFCTFLNLKKKHNAVRKKTVYSKARWAHPAYWSFKAFCCQNLIAERKSDTPNVASSNE